MPTATSTAFPPTTPVPVGTSTLPSGSTFDLIPPALAALERILASPNFVPSSSSASQGPTGSSGTDVSKSGDSKTGLQGAQAARSVANGASSSINGISSSPGAGSGAGGASSSLQKQPDPSVKDLPELMLAARHKIQAARDTVRGLPDIERSVAQQEADMHRVEQRIARLQRVWAAVRHEAAQRAKEGSGAESGEGGDEAVLDDAPPLAEQQPVESRMEM